MKMSRNQWIFIAAVAVVAYLWLRSSSDAASMLAAASYAGEEARKKAVITNTQNVLAQNEALNGETGYYSAADLGYKSPFAAGTENAGATLYVDIRPVTYSNNLPYDPNQSAVVI
jgi:hypothetical protein